MLPRSGTQRGDLCRSGRGGGTWKTACLEWAGGEQEIRTSREAAVMGRVRALKENWERGGG